MLAVQLAGTSPADGATGRVPAASVPVRRPECEVGMNAFTWGDSLNPEGDPPFDVFLDVRSEPLALSLFFWPDLVLFMSVGCR